MVEIISKGKPLKLGLPKGRMESGVLAFLSDAGTDVQSSDRDYRPSVSLENAVAKSMKPQNIIEMIALGRLLTQIPPEMNKTLSRLDLLPLFSKPPSWAAW